MLPFCALDESACSLSIRKVNEFSTIVIWIYFLTHIGFEPETFNSSKRCPKAWKAIIIVASNIEIAPFIHSFTWLGVISWGHFLHSLT